MTQRDRPVLLLDVDGVVNAVSATPPRASWPSSEWISTSAQAGGRWWRVLAARPVIAFLNDLSRGGRVEIRWLTTWGTDAAVSLAPQLGLDDFPVVRAAGDRSPSGYSPSGAVSHSWWKLPAAEDVLLEEGRAVIWLDDDIDLHARWGGLGALADRSDVLTISPQTNLGLTPKHLTTVATWLDEWDGLHSQEHT